ncbi:MAG: hypothetical protein ACK2UW_19925 [Anaerolineales bacterium]|jgi:hypothetical protein
MKATKHELSLDRPADYEVKIPGVLDECWEDWNGAMTIKIEYNKIGRPVTILTGSLDQAALHGLLRRLYALGLPLISVIYQEAP